jgi:hypothetical protein
MKNSDHVNFQIGIWIPRYVVVQSSWYRIRTLEPHCTENQIYVFPEKELLGLSPNSYIYLSMRDWSTYLAAAI